MDQSQPPERWARLWAAVQPHPVETGALGEYAVVLRERGRSEAERSFPTVAAHLATECRQCAADLGELSRFLEDEEAARPPRPAPAVRREPMARPVATPRPALALVAIAAGGVVVMAAAVMVLATTATAARALVILLALASLAMIVVLANATGRAARTAGPLRTTTTLSTTRRGLLIGVVTIWMVSTVGVYAIPTTPQQGAVIVVEASLRPWLAETIRRSPELNAIEWRLVGPEESGAVPRDERILLGLDRSPDLQGRPATPIARSIYVVAAWEPSLDRLGVRGSGPVDWPTIQRAVASPNGPRFVIPLPTTPLGEDGLLLLALAQQGPAATRLATDATRNPALESWLRPFYLRQARLRGDERIQADDWARYRLGVGEAGLLPEHAGLALQPIVEAQTPLHLRYPAVNVTRTYVLAVPSGAQAQRTYARLRDELLAPEAQRSLALHGFRPVGDGPMPTDGPFVTQWARGADWGARWAEAERNEAFSAWVRSWRP